MFSNQKQEGNGRNGDSRQANSDRGQISPPAISLPKGGGAIKGIGEKFAANPVTGTGSMSVPIATSPGRGGFGPQLSLTYDSGSGNGPFGFGWSLSLPSITRKTDKGLPKYQDAEESDVFILSGAEDLVPVLVEVNGQWRPETLPPRTLDGKEYQVRRYRPRIEGLFARIERWTNKDDAADTFWRSISKDNITTWYGKTSESRIADPADASRIFSWLICQSYDDKGNAIVYQYAEENDDNVDRSQANERNRLRTANRYLKRIKYGNRTPNRDAAAWQASDPAQLPNETWMFELVLDYGEGYYTEDAPNAQERVFAQAQIDPPVGSRWPVRHDPFSTYRASFEVRTYRLCRRALMFHHFPEELGINDCLVRSTEFAYDESPIASFITSVTQSGYLRQPDQNRQNRYLKKSLPPVEFEYSKVPNSDELAQQSIQEVDTESLENLPAGLDGANYEWLDLDGEGTNGILTEQGGGWYYKRNLSANNLVRDDGRERTVARLSPVELVGSKPATGLAGEAQFLDLAGDGQVDLAQLAGPVRGFYERTNDAGWEPFQFFTSWPDVSTRDPDLRFVDLTGDGHADILITEGQALTWYPSLAEAGFGPAIRLSVSLDEEKGPRLVFSDGEQAVYLADLSGDGLSDLVRIRNGEVCYWPNLGYGRFGAKVTMDHAPWFDAQDQFDQRRIRLADTDGSGTTDILYLRRDGVQIYFNQSGNGWSDAVALSQFPPIDNISSVQALDLLGNGTACLVWSSPLPGSARRPMRYLALMDEKPHMMVGTKNNLGAETRVHYAPSTKFYLDDKRAGKPWITRLPFLVHVVERVETYDHISRNRFVTRYAYHHGYFDGVEREFRGFGMVEQVDTEEFAALGESNAFPVGDNVDAASHVPPVLTKSWFHTGAYVGRDHISDFFAGLLDADDQGEYYREPGLDDTQAKALILPDTILPDELIAEEEREACRALKGAMLRQEVYAFDGTAKAEHPYSVTEQNFSIARLQPQGDNPFAVFFTHAREAISYHYERNPSDPRIQHALTLEVDEFGNVLKSVAIGYGRRQPDANLLAEDQKKQTQILITYTENRVTNAIDEADDYRTPLPAETRTYEITGVKPEGNAARFSFDEWTRDNFNLPVSAVEILYEQTADHVSRQKRLIEDVRSLYRKDDLTTLLPLGELEPMALPGESYKLAFTPGLLTQVYQRGGENLLPNPAAVLPMAAPTDQVSDRGGYVDLDSNGHWWIPSGQVFFSINTNDLPAQELSFARGHFFLPHRYRNPFHTAAVSTESSVDFDDHNLLMKNTRDALGNTVIAENDYRVLQPHLITDPNGNRAEAMFDVLGMVIGTAVKGKITENLGDNLSGFEADLTQEEIDNFQAASDPHTVAPTLLKDASTRILYDLHRFYRSQHEHPNEPALWEAPYAATLARETHAADPLPPQGLKIQISFSYSDGFGREIQKKIQAEPGPVPQRDATGKIIVGPDGQPLMTADDFSPRWVGSGWTVFNNKGKPVRQYEPFFTDRHSFEFDVRIGVSPVIFYDPVERVVATLHPNHTWEKVVFDPWQQTTYDVNDTVTFDPQTDADVRGFFASLLDADYLPTWHQQRIVLPANDPERIAAGKAAAHADTPTTAYFDTLGRPFLTIAHNKVVCPGHDLDGTVEKFHTRVEMDIEGNQREVIDAKDRIVMRYDYDMLGNRIHQASMEAGERWMLGDVAGQPIRAWDSRDHEFRTTYDQIRHPVESYLKEGTEPEIQIGRTVYGETLPGPEAKNLRGKVVQLFDQAGMVTSDEYDFKGNLLRTQRQLAREYKMALNWAAVVPLETETFTSRTRYDAVNRLTELTAPDSSVIRPTYNEANFLERVQANLRGAVTTTDFVTDIDYDAKGQRALIEYGNGVVTTYAYDPLTFRLTHLQTLRGSEPLQDLRYTYDPTGNITHIQDDAQQTIFFRNRRVGPSTDYTYDAVYRLIEATGREHLGQIGGAPIPHSHDDALRVGLLHPGDGDAMGRYLERYVYDAVGNFLSMQHRGSDPANPGWARDYGYNEPSLLELAKTSNRLSSTTIGAITETYSTNGDGYDAHGNMTKMPHLPLMQWDYRDELQATSQQVVNNGGTPEITYYVYDAAGQRVRKVTERQAAPGETATRMKERIYLGGFEIYREYNAVSGAVELERETLHIVDDKRRIALVETKTIDSQSHVTNPQPFIRYQLSNHLGSANLELDDLVQVISYEEYYPYGSTSYQAMRSQTETPKRYRYTGKERDEENGLYYFGARYLAPWLGRWTSTDPLFIQAGMNLFSYVAGNPIILIDPNGNQPQYEDKERYHPRRRSSKQPTTKQPTTIQVANEYPSSDHDVVVKIAEIGYPLEVSDWKTEHFKTNRRAWGGELSDLELDYVAALPTDPEDRVDPNNLTEEQASQAKNWFGTGADSIRSYKNYMDRVNIIDHFMINNAATVNALMGLYRISRDVNPLHFAFERGYQIGGGREMFTDQEVSRLGAAAELVLVLGSGYLINRALRALGPAPTTVTATRGAIPARASFSQKNFRNAFSSEEGARFSGWTVDDVAGFLKQGMMTPNQVPINYIVRDGNTLILNTRSAQALQQAGIPRTEWYGINRTGDPLHEALLTGQLMRNRLTSAGTSTVTRRGR